MDRDHVTGGGADRLERHDHGARDGQTRGDSVLEGGEHQVAHRVRSGDECPQGSGHSSEERPDPTHVVGHPTGHGQRHGRQTRRVDSRVDVDAHHGDGEDQDEACTEEHAAGIHHGGLEGRPAHAVQERRDPHHDDQDGSRQIEGRGGGAHGRAEDLGPLDAHAAERGTQG